MEEDSESDQNVLGSWKESISVMERTMKIQAKPIKQFLGWQQCVLAFMLYTCIMISPRYLPSVVY